MINKELKNILDNSFYKKFESIKDTYQETHIEIIFRQIGFPIEFYDEIMMLYFLYQNRNDWTIDIETINNFIKREVKKDAVGSMVKKIENDINKYHTLKNFLNKRLNFNNSRSIDYVKHASSNNIYFALHRVIRELPDYIKDSLKYNL